MATRDVAVIIPQTAAAVRGRPAHSRDPRAFALTKQQLRSTTLAQIDRDQAELGGQILEAWCAPEVGAAVKAHVARTLGRSK